MVWDGWYPAGEIRILVADDAGNPVSGVSLQVSEPAPGRWSDQFPLEENGPDSPLVSGADGVIICHSRGMRFGGGGWHLFWLFPVGQFDGPQFNFEFARSGCQSLVLSTDEFFHFSDQRSDAAPPVTTRLADRGDVTLPVWMKKVVMHAMSKR